MCKIAILLYYKIQKCYFNAFKYKPVSASTALRFEVWNTAATDILSFSSILAN